MKSEEESKNFLTYLNSRHPSIKFTMECEVDKKIPFLDILLTSTNGSFQTGVNRKKTFSGLYTNFTSFIPLSDKTGLIKTLVDRAYKICHDSITFSRERNFIKKLLCRHNYPPRLIDGIINKYLRNKETQNVSNSSDQNMNVVYAKLGRS